MEKIIYSDTLNQTELLRTLAKRGIKTLGLRVMSSYDLALFILSKLGISEKRRYLSNQEQDFIYYSLLRPDSFNDASNVRSAINTFRDTGKGNSYNELDQFLDKTFSKKLLTIEEAFTQYNQYKKDNNLYDSYDLLYELKNSAKKIDNIEITYFKDLPNSAIALETFNGFFDLKEESYQSFIGNKEGRNNIEVVKCYGTNNEFAYFVNKANDQQLNLDQCLLVLTDTTVFSDLANVLERFDIPYTSSIGVPFGRTNVGRLVNQLKRMKAKDYGVEAYKSLFSSPFFNSDNYIHNLVNKYDHDSFIQYAGWLRQGFESDANPVNEQLYVSGKRNKQRTHDICDALNKLINDINKNQSIYSFAEKNAVVDDYSFEALQTLKKYSDYCDTYGVSFDTVIDNLLNSSVAQHISSSGKLYVASLEQAFSCLREHVFVLGLDSSYPGSPTENCLIYDKEFENMGAISYTSDEVVKEKERLMNLLISCSSNCYLSYSFFNILDNKLVNPSSIIFGIANGGEPAFSYENDLLSKNVNVVNGFNQGKTSKASASHKTYTYNPKVLLNKVYSPSTFNKYFNEEDKPFFVLNSLFDINIDEEDDPHSVISARDLGTLFHSIVTSFDNSKGQVVEQDFVDQGLKAFDDFIAIKPPIIQEAADKVRESFEIGLRNFFAQDPKHECHMDEYKIKDCDVYGVHFGGRFDRLEVVNKGKPNEKYILVDYKTGYTNHHVPDDTLSCMQGLIYAEMIEKELGITVEKCVFRYPFINDESAIFFTKEKRDELKKFIESFAADVNAGLLTVSDLSSPYLKQYKVLFSLMKELQK